MPHTLKEFLEYAGGERWPTIGTEFVWSAMFGTGADRWT